MKNRIFYDHFQIANNLLLQAKAAAETNEKYMLLNKAIDELNQLHQFRDDHLRLHSILYTELGNLFYHASQTSEAKKYYLFAFYKIDEIAQKKDDDYREYCNISFYIYSSLSLEENTKAYEIMHKATQIFKLIHEKTVEEKQIGDPFVNIELFFSHYEKKFPEFRDAYSNFYQSKRAGLISAFQANNISLEVCNLQFNQLSISPLRTYALHQPAPAQQPQPIVNQADEMDVDNGPDFSAGPQ